MGRATAEGAEAALRRYNRLAAQAVREREQLERTEGAARRAAGEAFEALPDGYTISMHRDEPWVLVPPPRAQ